MNILFLSIADQGTKKEYFRDSGYVESSVIFYSFHATLLGNRENFFSFPKSDGNFVSSEFVNSEK